MPCISDGAKLYLGVREFSAVWLSGGRVLIVSALDMKINDFTEIEAWEKRQFSWQTCIKFVEPMI